MELRDGVHLAFPHTWLGAAIFVSVLITPLLGLLQFRLRRQAPRLRILHRWSGRLLLLFCVLNIVSGLVITGIIG